MQRTSTTRLPAALREQIDKEDSQSIRKLPKQTVSRKQARKQERQQLKQRKALFFSRVKSSEPTPNRKRPADHHQHQEPAKKKARLESKQLSATQKPHRISNDAPSHNMTTTTRLSTKKQTSRASLGSELTSSLPSRKPLNNIKADQYRDDRLDDARIAWLEEKLGITKGNVTKGNGNKKQSTFGDGLDDLMDDVDRIISVNTESLDDSKESEDPEASEFEGFSAVDWGDGNDEDQSLTNVGENNETSSIDADDQTATAPPVDTMQINAKPPADSRYVPPHLRQPAANSSDTLSKLSRQIKGLLNRLSEQNMASILASIEEIYRGHRRHDVTSSLTTLIVDGISSHSYHLDSFVVLHASLVTSLYKVIGNDFAAHFIQFLITSYEQHYQVLKGGNSNNSTDDEPKGKECLNLVMLLSELYNFQVISCVLVYDVIRCLLDTLNEFDVELLLKIVRNSGQQLRQDDPTALKDIIQIVHTKMSNKPIESISSRTQFMIETLTNLKNNKIKRAVDQDGRSEAATRMKKFLSGLGKKHHVMAHEPLRVSLDDLHSSEKRGKWWLVGSAWNGDPLVDRALEDKRSTSQDHSDEARNSLLALARKQGMNTDVRRGVFVVLMSSDDYIDACERLSQLNLTEVQQREIVRVVLHCLGNERQYNPYYTLVVQQLCQTSHSCKVTLQFCLWDFLRDLGEKDVGGAEIIKSLKGDDDAHVPFDSKQVSPTRRLNVARAYAWWITKGCCSLTILKPVDFTVLQTQSHNFFRELFHQLFVSSQVTSPAISSNANAAEYLTGPRIRESLEEVFMKATRVPTLTQGLIYFLTTALHNDNGSNNEVVSETFKWARGVAKDTLRTGKDVVASLT